MNRRRPHRRRQEGWRLRPANPGRSGGTDRRDDRTQEKTRLRLRGARRPAARPPAQKVRRPQVVSKSPAALGLREAKTKRGQPRRRRRLLRTGRGGALQKPARAIYINPFDMARPGQVRDGYFPDAVFADPRFVMPVLYRSLCEWIDGEPAAVGALLSELDAYGGVAAQGSQGGPAPGAMGPGKKSLRLLTPSRR